MIYKTKAGYRSALNEWYADREKLFADIYPPAWALTQLPRSHAEDFKVTERGNVVHTSKEIRPEDLSHAGAPGIYGFLDGPILEEKTELSYDALSQMIGLLVAQEEARESIVLDLRKACRALREWEADNPVPVYKAWWKPAEVFLREKWESARAN